MHWNHQTLRKGLAPPKLLAQKGRGVTFHYVSKKLEPNLWGLFGFRGHALVFLGLCASEAQLDQVLQDAQSRPQWKHVQWESCDRELKVTALELWGTPFQMDVWQAMLELSDQERTTYQHLAENVGRPKALRAVGTAVGANTIAGYIPCHQVLPKSGKIGGYRWGQEIKKILLRIS